MDGGGGGARGRSPGPGVDALAADLPSAAGMEGGW